MDWKTRVLGIARCNRRSELDWCSPYYVNWDVIESQITECVLNYLWEL